MIYQNKTLNTQSLQFEPHQYRFCTTFPQNQGSFTSKIGIIKNKYFRETKSKQTGLQHLQIDGMISKKTMRSWESQSLFEKQVIINIKEFVMAEESHDISKGKQISVNEYLLRLFSKFDVNNDGRLSKFEFKQLLKVLTRLTGATYPKRQDIEDIFNCLDTDGDQTINRQEYKSLTSHLESLFQLMDIKLIYMGNDD